MESSFLLSAFIFLAAACVVVPIAGHLRLGSVIGYLAAGMVIGPFGFRLIEASSDILHFAEFGVVMMLFLIGLELEPSTLWRLRRSIVGLGGLQVLLTSAAFTAIGIGLGYDWRLSLAVGMALSLSSTALVLQILQEKGLMQTSAGEASFSVLLFQDIAVIPILILMPLLAVHDVAGQVGAHGGGLLKDLPGWAHALAIAAVVVLIVGSGRYISRPIFRFVARTNLREVFTAISLGVVIGITLLMEMVGVSPALGAFVAGVVLANSEYRHTIETDILPFKGLLLGLFFISVGMGMDFDLLAQHTSDLVLMVVVLVGVKIIVLLGLGRFFGLSGVQDTWFALALAQGGEFAFVLFQFAHGLDVISANHADMLTLLVTISMVVTPFVLMLNDKVILPRFMSRIPERKADNVPDLGHPVMIIGYGRFGQIIGRFMSAQGVKLTILEKDPDQIELLRRFGNKVYFGDASQPELLRSAGAASAKLIIVCIDDADKILEIVRAIKHHFPHVAVFARSRNRRHAYELHKAGVDLFRRETFDGSLWMAQEAMKFLGFRAYDMRQKAQRFTLHDESSLHKSFEFFDREPELISFARQASSELERVLQGDASDDELQAQKNEGWGG